MSEIIDMQNYIKRGPDRIAKAMSSQPDCRLVKLEKKGTLQLEHRDAVDFISDLLLMRRKEKQLLTEVDHINLGNALRRMEAAMRELMRI